VHSTTQLEGNAMSANWSEHGRGERLEAATLEPRVRLPRRRLLGWTAGGRGAIAAGATMAMAPATPPASHVEGTWLADFRVTDAPPDRPPVTLRIALLTGGVVVAQVGPVSRNPDGSLNFLSGGLGVWGTSVHGFEFNYVYTRLLDQATRTLVATTWVALTITESADEWSGIWQRRDLDADGGVALETGGTVRAHRQPLEAL
jgi:hypothetical protein